MSLLDSSSLELKVRRFPLVLHILLDYKVINKIKDWISNNLRIYKNCNKDWTYWEKFLVQNRLLFLLLCLIVVLIRACSVGTGGVFDTWCQKRVYLVLYYWQGGLLTLESLASSYLELNVTTYRCRSVSVSHPWCDGRGKLYEWGPWRQSRTRVFNVKIYSVRKGQICKTYWALQVFLFIYKVHVRTRLIIFMGFKTRGTWYSPMVFRFNSYIVIWLLVSSFWFHFIQLSEFVINS